MMLRHAIFAMGLLVGLTGCPPDQNVSQLFPEITVAPPVLEFGEQGVLTDTVQPLYISNGGRVDLTLALSFQDGGQDAFSFETETTVVGPNDTAVIDVHFAPKTFLDFEDVLTITSNDQETPVIDVPLSGTGMDEPLPDIEFDTLFVDFGTADVAEALTQYVELKNVGRADLALGTFTQSGSGAFRISFDPSGQTVAADNSLPLILTYTPTQSEGDSGTLTIPSNDPDEPVVELTLIGNGGGAFEYPEAIIDCPGTSEPPQWISLDGRASNDPAGNEPLEYEWSLVERPSFSQGELSDTITDRTNLFTDVAGDYAVQLVVTNRIGIQSAPTKCLIDAIPADDIHIELTWDTARADLDLHLLEEGADFFERPGDCNFCNPSPSWGQSGTDDNPRLDLDDRAGYGPENINIKSPANGKYQIRVHYFDDQGDSAVAATVRIYTYGELTEELSRVLYRNDIWDVAQINWPAGTAGVYSNALYPADVRSCY